MRQNDRIGWHVVLLGAAMGALLSVAAPAAEMPPAGTPRARVHPPQRPPKADAHGPVTNATVADRVLAANTRADHEALSNYYLEKAAGEDARIAYFDALFRAYMKLEGKQAETLQRHARMLLKAARMSKQRYQQLGQTHRTIAWEWND